MEHGAALEAVEQRIPDRHKPMGRLSDGAHLNRNAQRGIRHRFPWCQGDDHVIRDPGGNHRFWHGVGHDAPYLAAKPHSRPITISGKANRCRSALGRH